MKNRVFAACVTLVGLCSAPAPAAEQPATPPPAPGAAAAVGSVKGTITVPQGRQLPETVVFLEPTDPARTFPAPEKPASFSQKDGQFIPQFQVIAVGQTVQFRNDESTPLEHNVFSRSPAKQFDLGLVGPDKPGSAGKAVVFDKPGEVAIYCSVHRYMDATIYVAPTPFFTIADKEGKFEIKGVPPGEYTVKTWQRRKRLNDAAEKVTIEESKEATKDLALTK